MRVLALSALIGRIFGLAATGAALADDDAYPREIAGPGDFSEHPLSEPGFAGGSEAAVKKRRGQSSIHVATVLTMTAQSPALRHRGQI